MRWMVLSLGVALSGCTVLPAAAPKPDITPPPENAQQAYFSVYPTRLFFAAAALCNGPGQSVVQPTQNEVRCESLPDPESAAAIILQFNGTVETLPTFVIAFSGRDTDQGYLVTADNYIRVPQRTGGAQQVRFPNPSFKTDMTGFLTAAGGQPL